MYSLVMKGLLGLVAAAFVVGMIRPWTARLDILKGLSAVAVFLLIVWGGLWFAFSLKGAIDTDSARNEAIAKERQELIATTVARHAQQAGELGLETWPKLVEDLVLKTKKSTVTGVVADASGFLTVRADAGKNAAFVSLGSQLGEILTIIQPLLGKFERVIIWTSVDTIDRLGNTGKDEALRVIVTAPTLRGVKPDNLAGTMWFNVADDIMVRPILLDEARKECSGDTLLRGTRLCAAIR